MSAAALLAHLRHRGVELTAEEQAQVEYRPVLAAEDVLIPRGKPPEAIRAALEVARAFPGARVEQ